ncbi:MAG TPA: hypothetical protein VJ724_03630 [Tahibacter sp.]|nr:hypothetical protein [Tahibacter sp.]
MHKFQFRILLRPLAALALAAAPAAWAGNTFTVVANGFGAWAIDGVDNPSLTLERGQTYTFQLQNVGGIHPFNINTIDTTGSGSRYNVGVSNNGATGNTAITFVVPAAAPNTLHYNCGNHAAMNGPITITDADGIFANGFEL